MMSAERVAFSPCFAEEKYRRRLDLVWSTQCGGASFTFCSFFFWNRSRHGLVVWGAHTLLRTHDRLVHALFARCTYQLLNPLPHTPHP